MHLLLSWDATLFHFINTGLSNPVFDALLPFCREKWFWAPVYLFLALFFLTNFGTKGWIFIAAMAVAVGMADFTSSSIIKKNVRRIRPCNNPEMVVQTRVPCGSGYSFTSSHAANHFAVAVFIIGLLGDQRRWISPLALLWAGLIAFSQVYVGVHYPLDVICGALLGAAIGWWAMKTLSFFVK
ncbi:MAG: phosphatase PAP2 family protein [Saprospiraceae bacterium]|nr:phosphatase PAP2 family protein [Saprospiraceae bacterium]